MEKIARFALLALPLACGSSSSSTPDAALPPAPDTAPVAPPDTKVVQACDHAAALCDKLAACAPFVLAAGYGDVATCAQRLSSVCTEQSKSTGSGLTLASILACEAALTAASCSDAYSNNLPACAFKGSYPDGATCGDNTQCTSGFCSHSGSLCGVCVPKGGNGAACPSSSNDECQSGLVCTSAKICATPVKVGGACDDTTAPCLPGAFCTSAKTCASTVALGAPCPGFYVNLFDGTVCWGKDSPSSPQTANKFATARPGEDCGLTPAPGEPATLCAPGSVAGCTLTTGGINFLGIPTKGICARPRDDGRTCTANSDCQTGSLCINIIAGAGICQIPSGRLCYGVDGGA